MKILQKNSQVCSNAPRFGSSCGSCIMSLFKIVHFFHVLTMLAFPCNCQSGPVWKLMILYLCEHEVLVWKPGWNGWMCHGLVITVYDCYVQSHTWAISGCVFGAWAEFWVCLLTLMWVCFLPLWRETRTFELVKITIKTCLWCVIITFMLTVEKSNSLIWNHVCQVTFTGIVRPAAKGSHNY